MVNIAKVQIDVHTYNLYTEKHDAGFHKQQAHHHGFITLLIEEGGTLGMRVVGEGAFVPSGPARTSK